MKIDVNSIRPVNQYKIASQNTAAIKQEGVRKLDKVEISSEARLFSDALRAAKEDIRERVEQPRTDLGEIKEKIERGGHCVDSGGLADDILLDK